MDKSLQAIIQKRIENTVTALRKNRFEAHYVPTAKEMLAEVAKRLSAGGVYSSGGSTTLKETGVHQLLVAGSEKGSFTFHNRFVPGADDFEICRAAFSCDVYLSGTNAITMDGKLYNVDGQANRVAAICFGPRNVIIVAGYNKIVADIPAAKERMRAICAPANATRYSANTPCVTTGACQDCSSDERLCSQELITGWQQIAERICVFIIGEEYGF